MFHHHTTNVNIRQLPHDTADAARLYGEMRDKAEREVANATVERLGAGNLLKIVSVIQHGNLETSTRIVRVLFTLNGELHSVRVSHDEDARRVLAQSIANKVAQSVFNLVMAGKASTP